MGLWTCCGKAAPWRSASSFARPAAAASAGSQWRFRFQAQPRSCPLGADWPSKPAATALLSI